MSLNKQECSSCLVSAVLGVVPGPCGDRCYVKCFISELHLSQLLGWVLLLFRLVLLLLRLVFVTGWLVWFGYLRLGLSMKLRFL